MAKSSGGLTRWFKENWVDLSRPKKGGGYEPCGRGDASKGKYPKCVPASRAASMSQEQIRSAISRKRRAESTKQREGKKPIMVSTIKKSKNVPTNPKLYARVKAAAKAKFDVYPSAYANGWLVAEYKRRGGKYKTVKRGVEKKGGLSKFNPNHDSLGRFTFTRSSGDGGSGNPSKKKVPSYLATSTQEAVDRALGEKIGNRHKRRMQAKEKSEEIINSPESQPTREMIDKAKQRVSVKNGKVVWNVFDKKQMQESVAEREQVLRQIASGELKPKAVEATSKKMAIENATESLQESRARLQAIIETESGK